jgi:glucose/arabinose dehydrogenase
MNSRNLTLSLVPLLGTALVACTGGSPGTLEAGIGPNPALPQPVSSLIPTLQVAPAIGWQGGATPVGAPGTAVNLFAGDLVHPRWIYVLPNGDVLVAESNAPAEGGAEMKGIRAFFMKRAQKKAGAGVPSADRITLLRDADGDGKAELRTTFLTSLHSPFGMALVGTDFYVANADALLRFSYTEGATNLAGPGTKVVDLPGGKFNHHWTKNVIATADGSRLYVTVGSNSNVAENGIEAERDRAAILEVDPHAGTYQIFASGLRNPNGLAWEPHTGLLWTAVNERDELGNNLVPDYITSVQRGAFYGWPYSYYGQHVDTRVKPQRPDLVATAIAPDYALGAHTASLGLVYSAGNALPPALSNGMFVGQHGSWNRKPPSGYKVIFVPFRDGKPAGEPVDVVSGFLNERGEAQGRPVGVAFATTGALLVADDVGNSIWRVAASVTP